MVLFYFCTFRQFKTFLCDFNRQFFEKINIFSVNTNLGKVSMIANDVFLEKLAVIQWKKCLVLLYFCTFRRFKTFLCDFNRQFFEKINVFSVNTNLGQVSMIANDVFSEKLAVIQWKKCLVLVYFCTFRRFKTFLCEFNRQLLRKSMFFQ